MKKKTKRTSLLPDSRMTTLELLKQHEKEAKEQLKKLSLGTMIGGKIKRPNFWVLSRLGLTAEKIIEKDTTNLFEKEDIIVALKSKGYKEIEPIGIKDYDPFVYAVGVKNGEREKFRAFEKNGDGIVTEKIYVYAGATSPAGESLDDLNRVELNINNDELGHFLGRLDKFMKDLKKRQRNWEEKPRKKAPANETRLAKHMMYGMMSMIKDLVQDHRNFFEIMTGRDDLETYPFPRYSVSFRIDGCKTKKQFEMIIKLMELWRGLMFGLDRVFQVRLGRRVKLQDEIWKEAIECYHNWKYLASEAWKIAERIRQEYEKKSGQILGNLKFTHKHQIALQLNAIMKEKGISGIRLGTLDDVEELAISEPENIALERMSRRYKIRRSYFVRNRDSKKASRHHLFEKYKQSASYRTLHKAK